MNYDGFFSGVIPVVLRASTFSSCQFFCLDADVAWWEHDPFPCSRLIENGDHILTISIFPCFLEPCHKLDGRILHFANHEWCCCSRIGRNRDLSWNETMGVFLLKDTNAFLMWVLQIAILLHSPWKKIEAQGRLEPSPSCLVNSACSNVQMPDWSQIKES